jgi:hypothetical protein
MIVLYWFTKHEILVRKKLISYKLLTVVKKGGLSDCSSAATFIKPALLFAWMFRLVVLRVVYNAIVIYMVSLQHDLSIFYLQQRQSYPSFAVSFYYP